MKTVLIFSCALMVVLLNACTHQVNMGGDAYSKQTAQQIRIDPKKMNQALDGFVKNGQLIGASAVIYQNDREVYFGAFGAANRETNQALSRDTLMRIYSMTKPVVGVALMQLYEQGLFKLEDPIAKYIPELSDLTLYAGSDRNGRMQVTMPIRQPTVLDFMRHTAGLGEENSEGAVGELWRKLKPMDLQNSLTEVATKIGQIPLRHEPGRVWRYGPSVEMQALMVERLSGQPLNQYLHKNIFTPLAMKQTGYYIEPERRQRIAQLYKKEQDNIITVQPYHATQVNLEHWARSPGSYGLISTLDDYMRFARMLLNGGSLDGVKILTPQTIALMATDYLGEAVSDRSWLDSKGRVGFGLDFAVRIEPPLGVEEVYGTVGEFFWDGYATTIFWVDPANQLAVVFFTQMIPYQEQINKQLRDAVYGVSRSEQ